MRKIICFIAMFFVLVHLYAQQNNALTGVVTDVDKNPIPGVTVVEKGTKNGIVTDGQGIYNLKLLNPQNAVLIFSFVGMKSQERPYHGEKLIDIVLESSVEELDEVVAIGYGTAKKGDLTGAISSVSGSDLSRMPVSNVADALKGKLAGVSVVTASGAPEADIIVRVRGGISVTQDNSPLYIIDGVPSESGLQGLNPTDIESIDVLKDASSTAIYGSRGANGVVLISMKKGKEGRSSLNYDFYFGTKRITKRTPVLNPVEFLLHDYEINGSDAWTAMYGPIEDVIENYGNKPGVDWQKQMFDSKIAISTMHKLSFTGGNSLSTYNVSYSYNKDNGLMPSSGVGKHAFRATYDTKMSSKLRFGTTVSYSYEGIDAVSDYNESQVDPKYMSLLLHRPTVGIYADDNELLTDNDNENPLDIDDPLTKLKSNIKKYFKNKFVFNLNANYTLSKKMTYGVQLGLTKDFNENSMFYTAASSTARLGTGPKGTLSREDKDAYYGMHNLMYKDQIGKHKFDFQLINEFRISKFKTLGVSANALPSENFGIDLLNMATEATIPTSNKESSKSVAFAARAGYSYNNKYLFNASLRADGSTKFGTNNKWGYFPAAAFAWRASEEPFIKDLNVFSNLKLRASYGVTGNDQIGNYRSIQLYTVNWTAIGNAGKTVFNPSLDNPDLKWEVNRQLNLGADVGLLKNKLTSTIEVYETKSLDLLMEAKIPYTSGYSTCMRNIGSTRSRGLEITLQSNNISTKDFSWTTNFNVAFNRMKVLKLADSDRWELSSYGSDPDFLVLTGHPTGLMYGYLYDGLYKASDFNFNSTTGAYSLKEGIAKQCVTTTTPGPGIMKFKDISGPDGTPDGIIDTNDKTIIGDANPDFNGGIMNSFMYKNFDLSFFCEFKVGQDMLNANIYKFVQPGKNSSTIKYVYDQQYKMIDSRGTRLLTMGDIEALDALNKNAIYPSNGTIMPSNSLLIENGSFLRLSQITIGYTIPQNVLKKLRVKTFRVYATASNLYTLTNYNGFDPDVSMNRNGGLTPGVDKGSYPRAKSFVIGANISF